MDKHLHITERGITEDGGIIFVFDDGSHTYLTPDDVEELFLDYNEIMAAYQEMPFKD